MLVSSSPDFINVLAAVCLSRVYPFGISETRDKYQHPPFICQGLRQDRNLPYWMSPSTKGSLPHCRMRYVTWGHWGCLVSCVQRSIEVNGKWRRKTFCSCFKRASRIRCVAFSDFSLTFTPLNDWEWRWLSLFSGLSLSKYSETMTGSEKQRWLHCCSRKILDRV